MSRSQIRLVVVAALATTVSACFEEPVRQHLHLHLAPGAVVTVWTHEIEPPSRAQGNVEVARRMDDDRDALARGLTPASGWFDRVGAAADRTTLERVDGLVRRARWSAVLTDPRELEDLLSAIGWTAYLEPTGSGVELVLEPSAPPRATRAQRQRSDEMLDLWSEEVADYLTAAIELYGYLDRHPDRAIACFTHLLEDDDVAAAHPLRDDEVELLERVANEIDDVASVLLEPSDDAYSANELSRLVYDPFPARLTVSVADGEVLSSQGLVSVPGGLERLPISLWQALAALEGTWIAPDLVTAMVAPAPSDAQPDPDPAAFASVRRRFAAPPIASEVAAAIRSRLAAVEISSVRWRGPAPGAGAGESPDARHLLDAGEHATPR